jgi:hypothetical protein
MIDRCSLTAEINILALTFDCSQSDILSHNSQFGYVIGTLKHKFGLKLRWRMSKNGLRLIINFGRK